MTLNNMLCKTNQLTFHHDSAEINPYIELFCTKCDFEASNETAFDGVADSIR